MVNLDRLLVEEIVKIIRARKEPDKIILFGSRANGDNKERSDIDIAIIGKNWDHSDIADVHDKLEYEVRTPLKFDVLNFHEITKESLKEDILSEGVVLYDCKKNK